MQFCILLIHKGQTRKRGWEEKGEATVAKRKTSKNFELEVKKV